MDTTQLIHSLMRQMTVMIAQLSTAAGIRAPLSRVADQVFYELAREIERQGVRQKVAADMFGMALRAYQKKIQRLNESVTERNTTLWEVCLDFIAKQRAAKRRDILHRLRRDEERDVAAVLHDLVTSGLVTKRGRGDDTVYQLSTSTDHHRRDDEHKLAAEEDFVWLRIAQRGSLRRSELFSEPGADEDMVGAALERLLDSRRIKADDSPDPLLSATSYVVPVGAERGWEAAVFDHFQAVTTALAAKVRRGQLQSAEEDLVGGSTLQFDLSTDHPLRGEVLGLLASMRQEVMDLWGRVEEHNRQHPTASEELRVWFYFGQNVEERG